MKCSYVLYMHTFKMMYVKLITVVVMIDLH